MSTPLTWSEALQKPSPQSWQKICRHLQNLTPSKQKSHIGEALRALSSWPDHLREAPKTWKQDALRGLGLERWNLVRCLRLEGAEEIQQDWTSSGLLLPVRVLLCRASRLSPEDLPRLLHHDTSRDIHTLDLDHCALRSSHLRALSEIRCRPSLRELSLRSNDVSKALSAWFKHNRLPSLKVLRLGGQSLHDIALRHLPQSAPSLEELHLARASLRSCASVSRLRVKRLNLQHNRLDAQEVREVLRPPLSLHLEELDLRHNQLEMEALPLFATAVLARLRRADLRHNPMLNTGTAAAFAGNSAIVLDALSPQTDPAEDLPGLAKIRAILYHTPSSAEWGLLCEALKDLPEGQETEIAVDYVLHHLEGWDHALRTAPPAWILRALEGEAPEWPLARALEVPRGWSAARITALAQEELLAKMTILHTRGTRWDEASICALLASPHSLKTLRLVEGCRPEATRALARNNQIWRALTSLDISQTQQGEETLMLLLQALKASSLKALDLSATWPGKTAESLREVPLERLVYHQNRLASTGFAALLQHPTLTSLSLSSCRLERSTVGLIRATSWAPLKTLSLSHNPLGGEGASRLAQNLSIPSLRVLDWSDIRLTDEGLESVCYEDLLTPLTALNLSQNHLSEAGLQALIRLAALPHLTHLDLSHCQLAGNTAALLSMAPWARNLKYLNLAHNDLGDRGVAAFAYAQHISPDTIDLRGCRISRPMVETLRRAPHLQKTQVLADLS